MPTTSERRPISRLTRSSGLVERSFVQWSRGKRRKATSSSSASTSSRPTLRGPLQPLGHVGQHRAAFVVALGGEDLAQRGGHQRLPGLCTWPSMSRKKWTVVH